MHFFYVKLPVGSGLADREGVFHEGLEAALAREKAGFVLGWGDSLSTRKPSRSARVAFHRIDIEVKDVEVARALLQRTLVALDAPVGTEIHYTVADTALQDVFGSGGWRTEPRSTTAQHPGRPA
jgi:hypothetical protein